jgi:hypothetical protein
MKKTILENAPDRITKALRALRRALTK